MDDLRVAISLRTGQKVFTLQTVPARQEPGRGVTEYADFRATCGSAARATTR